MLIWACVTLPLSTSASSRILRRATRESYSDSLSVERKSSTSARFAFQRWLRSARCSAVPGVRAHVGVCGRAGGGLATGRRRGRPRRGGPAGGAPAFALEGGETSELLKDCLLYTSDAADE